MTISYTVTIDDMIAFVRYHFATSPEVARIVRAVQLLSFLVVLGICVVLGLLQGRPVLWLLLGGVIGVGVAATYPMLFIRLAERAARRLHTSDESRFGRHTLLLEGDTLIERSEAGEQQVHVNEVMRVDHTAEHVFIYLIERPPRVIRRGAVEEGDLDSFVDALEAKV